MEVVAGTKTEWVHAQETEIEYAELNNQPIIISLKAVIQFADRFIQAGQPSSS